MIKKKTITGNSSKWRVDDKHMSMVGQDDKHKDVVGVNTQYTGLCYLSENQFAATHPPSKSILFIPDLNSIVELSLCSIIKHIITR